ncbi:MAG: flagellar protein FlgN [Bacteriovoracaceae bacterium]|nr:flagellar protein FlgN [Bacteriovoracaceae bacterium]
MNKDQTKEKNKLQIFYFQIVDIWHRLCKEHTNLLDLTCEEYSLLLSNDINDLEKTIHKKRLVMAQIDNLDKLRSQTIENINEAEGSQINSVSELLETMNQFEEHENQKHLWRFNQLLTDIIEKIQEQNKRNQIFISKASRALQEIKNEILGEKNYVTYTANGIKTSSTNSRNVTK